MALTNRNKEETNQSKDKSPGHAQCIDLESPQLTIGGSVLKESDDLDILGITFDSNTSSERHLRLVSMEASQRLGT